MPPEFGEGAGDIHVLRIVLREGFSRDMAELLIKDLSEVVDKLEQQVTTGELPVSKHFAHT